LERFQKDLFPADKNTDSQSEFNML